MENDEVLIRVDKVSKKFCKDLKTSLKYGLLDISRELTGKSSYETLRPKEFWAVSDISFQLKRGDCLALIGHNGAGKSTLLKMLNGLIKPDKGRIEMRGRVAALIELGAGFNPVLTGKENIYNNASILGLKKREIDALLDEIIDFSEIGDFIDMPVRYYSSGMKVRLGFAVASHLKPDVLILDEVLAVGDAGFRIKSFNKIKEVIRNAAVIFVSHSMPTVSRICNLGLFMDHGKSNYFGDNMAFAIQEYFSGFKTEEAGIEFNDGVDIKSIKVNGKETKPDELIDVPFANDLNLDLSFNFKRKVDYYSLHIQLVDKDLKIVGTFKSTDFFVPVKVDENSSLQVVIKNFRFTDGEYAFTYFITEVDETGVDTVGVLCTYRNYTRIRVTGLNCYIYAPVYMDGHISQSNNELKRIR